jgi:hypothetical protein
VNSIDENARYVCSFIKRREFFGKISFSVDVNAPDWVTNTIYAALTYQPDPHFARIQLIWSALCKVNVRLICRPTLTLDEVRENFVKLQTWLVQEDLTRWLNEHDFRIDYLISVAKEARTSNRKDIFLLAISKEREEVFDTLMQHLDTTIARKP